MKPTHWKDFERAVAAFVAALDPHAVVTHDVRVPDRDTGHPRQCDVWVETSVLKLQTVRILISCKSLRRKLNEQDVDAFVGEIRSSGAHLGILYALTGYTEPALKKATVLGIGCCKLYRDAPADIPQSLVLTWYCCASSFRIAVDKASNRIWAGSTLEEVLSLVDHDGVSVCDRLAQAFWEKQNLEIQEATEVRRFPGPWAAAIELGTADRAKTRPILSLHGHWRLYRARLEGHLLNGTYSFTEARFVGSQAGPWIDMVGPEPGPGWERISDTPSSITPGMSLAILRGGNVKELIFEHFGSKKLKELAGPT